jgi:hypothetical protein
MGDAIAQSGQALGDRLHRREPCWTAAVARLKPDRDRSPDPNEIVAISQDIGIGPINRRAGAMSSVSTSRYSSA